MTETPHRVADRLLHTALWTGEELLIWGGRQEAAVWLRGNGARYDPRADAWRTIPRDVPRIPRGQHTAGWTGQEMLIWGGFDGRRERGDGAAYRPE